MVSCESNMRCTAGAEERGNIIKTGKVDKEKLYELAKDAISVGVGFRKRSVVINLDIVMEICNQDKDKEKNRLVR